MTKRNPGGSWPKALWHHAFRALLGTLGVILCMGALGGCEGCACEPDPQPPSPGLILCQPPSPRRPLASLHASRATAGTKTVSVGRLAGTFAVTNTGEATYSIPLTPPPGRASV